MTLALSNETVTALLQAAYAQPGPKTHHITRLSMYLALQDVLVQDDSPDKSCLALSHSTSLARLLGLAQGRIVEANYPEHNLLDLQFSDGQFDYCVSDQVLEHVEGDPFHAFAASTRGFNVRSGCLLGTKCSVVT